MYSNLKDNKIFGYGLNLTKSKKNVDNPFVNKETNELIDYNVDNDCFLKPHPVRFVPLSNPVCSFVFSSWN